METPEVKKVQKSVTKKATSTAIRVSVETRKRLLSELARINKKQFGKNVRIDALVTCLLAKLAPEDVTKLQEASLRGRDRVEQSYRAYCTKNGHVSMDDYLARLAEHASSQIAIGNDAKS